MCAIITRSSPHTIGTHQNEGKAFPKAIIKSTISFIFFQQLNTQGLKHSSSLGLTKVVEEESVDFVSFFVV